MYTLERVVDEAARVMAMDPAEIRRRNFIGPDTFPFHHPLGVKGAGEAGATGAPAAVINAAIDALSPLAISSIDMPATPAKVWRLIQEHGLLRA